MARQFIAGRDGADVMKTLRKKRRQKIGFTVDLLGEAVVSEKEADEYAARGDGIARHAFAQTRGWTDPLGKNSELFPVVNLSLKISAFYSQMDPAAPEEAIEHLAPKLRPILRRAKEVGAFINFDMESYAQKNSTLDLFKQLFTEPEFADWPHVGIVIQAYLRDAERDLRELIEWGRKRGTRFAVRLVKGAYWDYEKIIAATERLGLPGLSAEAGERRELRSLHAHPARQRIDRHRRLRFAQRAQHRPRECPTRRSSGSIRAASSSSSSTAWRDRSSARWSRWVIGCANIRRSANCFPACLISSGGCSRTLPTKVFSGQIFR